MGATSALAERARAAVERDAVVALTQQLVRIPTVNPPGETRAACGALAAHLEPAGFECEEFEPTPPHLSLIATHEFSPGGRTLVLNGHVDVVPAGEGWTRDPFGGELIDGRLYGRGAVDMKGAVAGMVVAAAALARSDLPLRGRLVVMAVADEEQGGVRGSGAIVDAGKGSADAVVIGEPSDRGVVVAHRGTCFLRVRTHGRAGHASMPENFDNAVEHMLDVLTACRELRLTYEPHPLLGEPTIAIGTTIAGGTKMNVVPDACEATLDIRTVPGMTAADVVEELVAHVVARGLRTPEQFELELIVSSEPAVTADDEEIVALAADASAREFGAPAELRGMTAATDGWNFSNRAGAPTVMGLGPGSIRDCHVADESVSVDELAAYARIYADVSARYLAGEDR